MTDIFEAHGQVCVRCCATCRNWKPAITSAFGLCEHQDHVGYISDAGKLVTTDLALCSKWQQKDDE